LWFACFTVTVPCASARAQGRPRIEQLAWLQGCWGSNAGPRIVEEQWMAPRGRSMLGMSRTVRGEALIGYEHVVIREQGERLSYEAHPSGQPEAVFLSTAVTGDSVVFENRAHDFPQRVGYTREGESLNAWIEGTDKGKPRRVDFAYRRVSCPGL
jgi:hypothetical protein